jgi:hypothetical protein
MQHQPGKGCKALAIVLDAPLTTKLTDGDIVDMKNKILGWLDMEFHGHHGFFSSIAGGRVD